MDVDDSLSVASKKQMRPTDRIVASGIALAITLTTLLILSPMDARHLLEALLRLIHLPTPAESAVAPLAVPPKAIDVTLVPKPLVPQVPLPIKQLNVTPAVTPTGQATRTASSGEAAVTGPAGQGTKGSPPQAAALPQRAAPMSQQPTLQGVAGTAGQDSPMLEVEGKTSNNGGATRGLELPALNLSLTAFDIAQLLATGTAVVVASSSEGKTEYVLGTDHRFTTATAEQLASISPADFRWSLPTSLNHGQRR